MEFLREYLKNTGNVVPKSNCIGIYRPQFGNMLSIFQRMAGVYLFLVCILYGILEITRQYLSVSIVCYMFYYAFYKCAGTAMIIGITFSVLLFIYHVYFGIILELKVKNLVGDLPGYYNNVQFYWKRSIFMFCLCFCILVVFLLKFTV